MNTDSLTTLKKFVLAVKASGVLRATRPLAQSRGEFRGVRKHVMKNKRFAKKLGGPKKYKTAVEMGGVTSRSTIS